VADAKESGVIGTTLAVGIESHHVRERQAVAMAERLGAQGAVRAVPFIDRTTHFRKTDHSRWRGNFMNYRAIVEWGTKQTTSHVGIFQDDISVPDQLVSRIVHVMGQTSWPWAAFYVPQNQLFTRAVAEDYHVVETYSNFWIQAMVFRRSFLTDVFAFAERHLTPCWEQTGDGNSDDDWLNLFGTVSEVPVRVVVPSLVQHVGAYASLFGTAGKIGPYDRLSACYQPDFDVSTVDWATTKVLTDRSKLGKSHPRWQRTVGLLR
jgi:hypothetical protein